MYKYSCKNISVKLDNNIKFIKFAHVPDVCQQIILGVNFLNIFSFKRLRLVSDNDQHEIISIDDYDNLIDENSSYFNEDNDKFEIPHEISHRFENIIKKFKFNDNNNIGCQNILFHHINTGDHQPLVQNQYNYNPKVLVEIHKIIDEWLKQGIIEKSTSAWRNPIVAVKKQDKKLRLCLDARKLNNITKKDRLLTPNVFDSLYSIPYDAKIFGRVDKNQAFLQTMLRPADKEKTAFYIKGRGLFQFIRMPFGLANAPATQTRLMLEIFSDLSPYVMVYFDDIIVMGRDNNHFLTLLDQVDRKSVV